MSRRKPREDIRTAQVLASGLVALALATIAALLTARELGRPTAAGPDILVYSDIDCRDCAQWVEYLRDHGFRTNVAYEPSRNEMRSYLGVPAELAGSHVALVQGYIIEGHVPAEDIVRLLAERPDARGLSVPGRPPAAPGMEGFGGGKRPYDVLLFRYGGATEVFAHH